jgi:hypothetical protein
LHRPEVNDSEFTGPAVADRFLHEPSAETNSTQRAIHKKQAELGLVIGSFDDEYRTDYLPLPFGQPGAGTPFLVAKDEFHRNLGAVRLMDMIVTVVSKILYPVDVNEPAKIAGRKIVANRDSGSFNLAERSHRSAGQGLCPKTEDEGIGLNGGNSRNQTIERITPPSTLRAAPFVAAASELQT